MALLTTGYISLGGNVAGRSVAKELNDGAPNFTSTISLNDGNVRSLAQRTGSVSISMSHLRGKSAGLDTQTVTVGYTPSGGQYQPALAGYRNVTGTNLGSISDGTFNVKSGAFINTLYWTGFGTVIFSINGSHSNSGWTTMKIGNTTFTRASSTFSQSGTSTATWAWYTITTNPFGTSGTKTVVFN